jgi:starch-binding outer membrane protein, SusD/RagB family
MRIRRLQPLLVVTLLAAASACESALEIDPTDAVPEEAAIVDAGSARAAVRGIYDALQSTDYYAAFLPIWGDLSADNTQRRGTFTYWREADQHRLATNNGQVEGAWDAIYETINRANVVIAKVLSVPGLSDSEKNQMVGEAHFIRALGYHDLVKLWGAVPIKTTPITNISEASQITRASVGEVYTQILDDLRQAEALMTSQGETRSASIGAVRALRARVLLYQASRGPTGMNTQDWEAVLTAADAVLAMGYSLAPEYSELFHAVGANTPEDIFRIRFIAEDAYWVGYYYHTKPLGGRIEAGPTTSVRSAYEAGDARRTWSIKTDPSGTFYVSKFPTPIGAEHPHVIRLAEVILIRAEALAKLNRLPEAVTEYNRLRTRAKVTPHVFGVNVTDQASVLTAIDRERRLELAFEGDRWPDLVRSDRAVAVEGLTAETAYQVLYPIPQNEIDVTRGSDGQARLTQNPGY